MKLSVWYETADSFYFLSYRDEEIRTLTEALARVLKTEEGRNQARQLIHAHENDDVDSKSTSTGSEITCDSEDWNSEEWESADEAEGSYGALVVHDPVERDSIHRPPFPSCENTTKLVRVS